MRRIDFQVPIYDWKVSVVTILNKYCYNDLRSLLDEFDVEDSMKTAILKEVKAGSFNGGKTLTRKGTREVVVILFPWKTELDFIRTLNHEKRHVIDDIVEWHDLDSFEAAAYLDGYISCEIYKRLGELK